MKASQPLENLVLLLQLGLEALKGLLRGTQLFLGAFQDSLVFFRTVKIVLDARVIVLEAISEFPEDGLVEPGGVGRGLQTGVVVQPLVGQEHLGIYVRHVALPYDAAFPARRQKKGAHEHGQDEIFRNLPHETISALLRIPW